MCARLSCVKLSALRDAQCNTEELLFFRQLAQEMKEVAAQRQQEEEAFYRQQELMIDAENQRRAMIGQEEQKLTDQRSRFVHK